jgi:hypothetical protein
MKKFLSSGLVVIMCLVATLTASADAASKRYVPATVLQVEKHEVGAAAYPGGNPSDAPLRCQYYAYDVSVRLNCGTYVARYETPFEYFPAVFSPGRTIPVRVTKRILYFNVPDYQDMKMGIVRKIRDQQHGCADSEQAK